MNSGSIWWEQLGTSLQLLERVTDCLRESRSFVLEEAAALPWRNDFFLAVDTRRAGFSQDRRLKCETWTQGMEPGEFVLREFCPRSVQIDYWPGQTHAEYLAGKADLALNDYFVWITGIRRREDLTKWLDFVSRYESLTQDMERRAVFALEYDGPHMDIAGIEVVSCRVERFDCRVFCLEMASALKNVPAPLFSYQAELTLCVGQNDPELCAALLQVGEALLADPTGAARQAILQGRDSRGRPFPVPGEAAVNSAAWQAALIFLFPILERRRSAFIARHSEELARHLPIQNSNGDRVEEPCDLEIGPLYYIVSSSGSRFTPEEQEELRLCRRVRNLLAHNRLVPYADIQAVLALA